MSVMRPGAALGSFGGTGGPGIVVAAMNSRVKASKSIGVPVVLWSLTSTVTRSPVVDTGSRNTAGSGVPGKATMLSFASIGLMRFSVLLLPLQAGDTKAATRAAAQRRADRVPESGGVAVVLRPVQI